jgi:pimeloyl-ACP methyl ester carboxylesterase
VSKEAVLHLHGFASSAYSAKARYLGERFRELPRVRFLVPDLNPMPSDFQYLTITGMINRLRQYILDQDLDNFSIIGSSMGCLVALHYSHRFGGVKSLFLLAPLLSYGSLPMSGEMLAKWEREGATEVFHYRFNEKVPLRYDFHLDGLCYQKQIPPPVPVRIIHGRNDETIPVEHSRKYAAKYPDMVTMREVDSDHALLDHLDFIWGQVASMLDSPGI